MPAIVTNSNKAQRSVTTDAPDFLDKELSLEEIVEIIGEDVAKARLQSQLLVDYRGKARNMLEATVSKEDDTLKYTEADVIEEMKTWKPTLREVKSAEEKIRDLAASSGMSREELIAFLSEEDGD